MLTRIFAHGRMAAASRFYAGSLVLLVLFCGCGDSDFIPGGDLDLVIQTVSNISDAQRNPDQLNALFVSGSEPDDAWKAEARKYMLCVVKAEVSGDTAVATVELEDAASGDIVRTHEWECERIGEEWKIKTSPIQ